MVAGPFISLRVTGPELRCHVRFITVTPATYEAAKKSAFIVNSTCALASAKVAAARRTL